MWKALTAMLAMTALPAQAVAASAEGCLPREEAETLFTAMLPSFVETLHERCAASLPATAPLAVDGRVQAERYAAAADAARPSAEAIAARMLADQGEDALPPEMTETLGLAMFEAALTATLAGEMDAEACVTADRFFAALRPLPAANAASLLVLFLEIGQRDEAPPEATPFRLCRTG